MSRLRRDGVPRRSNTRVLLTAADSVTTVYLLLGPTSLVSLKSSNGRLVLVNTKIARFI